MFILKSIKCHMNARQTTYAPSTHEFVAAKKRIQFVSIVIGLSRKLHVLWMLRVFHLKPKSCPIFKMGMGRKMLLSKLKWQNLDHVARLNTLS